MPVTEDQKPTEYIRKLGPGQNMDPADVMKNVAKFADLQFDPNAFKDKTTNKALPIKYMISSNNKAGPAGISTQHQFHMAFIESAVGNSPVIHSHEYREIFMPIRGRYAIYFNEDDAECVELGPLDCFSVPPYLWRRVEQIEDENGTKNGLVMVLYDDVDDPNEGIYVPQSVLDADKE